MSQKSELNTFEDQKFELVMPDGALIPGQFGSWCLHRLGQKRKLGLTGLSNLLQSNDLGLDVISDYVLAAIEHVCRVNKQPFSFTDIDLFRWADATGDAFGALNVLFSVSFSNIPTEEKKSDPNLLSGMSSEDTQLPPES
jgi:hypothetical protein